MASWQNIGIFPGLFLIIHLMAALKFMRKSNIYHRDNLKDGEHLLPNGSLQPCNYLIALFLRREILFPQAFAVKIMKLLKKKRIYFEGLI